MIKVNLLKNRAGGTIETGTQTFAADEGLKFSLEEETESSNPAAKILVILLWVVALVGWEKYNLSQLDAQLASLKNQSQQLATEITTMRAEVRKAEALTKDYEAFKNKIELVKELGRLRLREIRAIDHLQNIIPEKAWFTSFQFENNQFEVEGIAANDQILDSLLEGIRRHPGFKDVLLAKAVEEKTPQGTLKVFLISSSMEGGG